MKRLAVLCICASAFFPFVAAAHDVFPPAWRGLDGTTYQEWQFGSKANPAAPDVINNSYGSAIASITVGAFGEGWMDNPGLGTQTGMWDLGSSGQIVLNIDNRRISAGFGDISIQVTYYGGLFVAPTVAVPGAQFISSQTVLVESDGVLGAWYLGQSIWHIEPNPFSEQIIVTSDSFGGMVDQIVVDTICVPEPATITLLTVAGLAILRRRKIPI
jgi:hypothetical protein